METDGADRWPDLTSRSIPATRVRTAIADPIAPRETTARPAGPRGPRPGGYRTSGPGRPAVRSGVGRGPPAPAAAVPRLVALASRRPLAALRRDRPPGAGGYDSGTTYRFRRTTTARRGSRARTPAGPPPRAARVRPRPGTTSRHRAPPGYGPRVVAGLPWDDRAGTPGASTTAGWTATPAFGRARRWRRAGSRVPTRRSRLRTHR